MARDPEENSDSLGPLLKLLVGLVSAFALAGFALASWMLYQGGRAAEEAFRLLLQFLLVTGVGGILVAALGALRDRETEKEKRRKDGEEKKEQQQREKDEERAARIAILQDIDVQLGKTYRELKTAKRQLRAQILEAARDEGGRPRPPYVFAEDAFRRTMADLLAAQIRAEDIRDRIRVRGDLFGEEQFRRINERLYYASRFFHDVHEDLERGKVRIEDGHCRVGEDCSNIDSLINASAFPADLPPEIKTALDEYLRSEMSMAEQHRRIDEIEQLRQIDKGKRRRFRAIADDCFALASAEIRRAVAAESGAVLTDDPQVTHRSYKSSSRTMDS
jgi:hypothetical protein